MRYHHDENAIHVALSETAKHPLYDNGTLYKTKDGRGLVVVQLHYAPKMKVAWWGPIRMDLMYSILSHSKFKEYFDTHAAKKDEDGSYPTFPIRKVMWWLKMKPLPKSAWEQGFDS